MSAVDNLDFFICTHVPFETKVTNPVYKVLYSCDDFDCPLEKYKVDKGDLPYGDRFYSEFVHIHWAAQNLDLKDYVGICHYRRYFNFFDNVERVTDNAPLFPTPKVFARKSNYSYYANCHNAEDLDICREIVKEHFNEYLDDYDVVVYKQNKMFANNMFVMAKEDFLEYDRFVIGVGKLLAERIPDPVEHILANKEKYLKRFQPNSTVEYQQRLYGYVMERLTTVFALHRFKKIRSCKITLTQTKYPNEKQLKNSQVSL